MNILFITIFCSPYSVTFPYITIYLLVMLNISDVLNM